MKKSLMLLCTILIVFGVVGNVHAIPQTVDFSVWPGSPTSTGQVDLDTVAANDWYYTNYGLEFSNVYMYWDSRDAFDNIGVANDSSSMPDYNGGIGYFYFADTTDYVTVDWTTISSQDIYLDVYNTSNILVDSYFYSGSGTSSGTTTLAGSDIAMMSFHDSGGQVGISTLSYDYDGFTDGQNDDTAPVPEPSTILLMGAGLLGLVGYNRKRFSNKR